jgi:pyruvate dehydrogenase E2 component (dihydrolipoyllysine-residue acetyltransferase)
MTDIVMPKLSDTMEEGKIIRWLKQRGDRVAIGDILAEVETDKANMELEAFDEGVLSEIRTAEGEAAPVGAVIAVLAEPGAATASDAAAASNAGAPAARSRAAASPATAAPTEEEAADAAEPPAEEARREAAVAQEPAPAGPEGTQAARAARPDATAPEPAERMRASPLAKKIARERGVDLSAVAGTGPGGRIVERDVEQASTKRPPAAEPAARPRVVQAPAKPATAESVGTRVELGKIRRATAKRMAEAKRDIPHFYASSDLAMDECVRLKDGLAALEGEYTGITYTHLVLKAVGVALRRVPEMNASRDGDTVVLHETVHVGLATATDDGLVVPVVRDCDRQPLGVLVAQARALVERARAGKFAADDLRGATFTVSNLGMYPVSHFAAVVNPPQVAILAVGAVREVPVVRDGTFAAGHVMTVTLSCDHRVVDGVLAGRFLKELNALLGSPLALVA